MADQHHPPRPPQPPREIVRADAGGWISGPGLRSSSAPVTVAMLGALFPGWAFTCDPGMGVWCAERRRGTEIRFLCAATVRDLAAKVAAAER